MTIGHVHVRAMWVEGRTAITTVAAGRVNFVSFSLRRKFDNSKANSKYRIVIARFLTNLLASSILLRRSCYAGAPLSYVTTTHLDEALQCFGQEAVALRMRKIMKGYVRIMAVVESLVETKEEYLISILQPKLLLSGIKCKRFFTILWHHL